MIRTALAAAVESGLDEPDPQASIRMVKDAIRRGIASVDATTQLHDTGYFNHTFAPDFILNWQGAQSCKRPVYLKFADDIGHLVNEIDFVAESHPLIIGLDVGVQATKNSSEVHAKLQETTRSNDTILTNPDGLVELERGQQRASTLKLFNRALLQGGRGVLDGESAALAATNVAAGISGAQSLDPNSTRKATRVLDEVLAGSSRTRVQRFVQALWVGSGGSESNFPGETAVSGTFDDDALAFLIQIEGIAETADFWRRIGSQLTVDQIARLPLAPKHYPNLQSLISANYENLWARTLKVVDKGGQLGLEDSDSPFSRWLVKSGMLALETESFEAYIGTLVEQLDSIEAIGREPHIRDLLERAHSREIKLSEVLLAVGNRFLSYGSSDHEDVSNDPELGTLMETITSYPQVKRAVANLSSGKSLNFHFSRSLAMGDGPAKISLKELVSVGTALLHEEARPIVDEPSEADADQPDNGMLF